MSSKKANCGSEKPEIKEGYFIGKVNTSAEECSGTCIRSSLGSLEESLKNLTQNLHTLGATLDSILKSDIGAKDPSSGKKELPDNKSGMTIRIDDITTVVIELNDLVCSITRRIDL